MKNNKMLLIFPNIAQRYWREHFRERKCGNVYHPFSQVDWIATMTGVAL